MLGKIEGRRRRHDRGWDGWMASPTPWTWVWVSSGSWWWTGKSGGAAVHGVAESDTTEQLNWTDWCTFKTYIFPCPNDDINFSDYYIQITVIYLQYIKFKSISPLRSEGEATGTAVGKSRKNTKSLTGLELLLLPIYKENTHFISGVHKDCTTHFRVGTWGGYWSC